MTRHASTTPEEQLELLLQGALEPGDVDSEVAELFNLASSLQEMPIERPEPAFKMALRDQLVHQANWQDVPITQRVSDAIWHRTAKWRHSAKLAVASGVASSMLGSMGVAAAAQYALPGDALYGVKLFTEDTRTWLATNAVSDGRLQLGFAEERLGEILAGHDRISADDLVSTLGRMDDASLEGSDLLLDAFNETGAAELLTELEEFAARQKSGLTLAVDLLPAEVRPIASNSLEVLRRIEVAIADAAAEQCDCPDEAPAASSTGSTASDDSAVNAPGDGPARERDRGCDCRPGPAPAITSEPQDEPAGSSTEESTPDDEPVGPTGDTAPEQEEPGRTVIPEVPGLGPVNETTEPVDEAVTDLVPPSIEDLIVPDDPATDLPGSVVGGDDDTTAIPGD